MPGQTLEQKAERAMLLAEGCKRCPRCQEVKPLERFGRHSRRPDGVRTYCRPCTSIIDKAERDRNRERRRSYELKSRYGISGDEYAAMREAQGGRCRACNDELLGGRFEHLDHCHAAGHVRGILCINCNLALGYVKDDPERLRQLIAYVSPTGH